MVVHYIAGFRWAFFGAIVVASYLAFAPVPEDSVLRSISDKLQHLAAFFFLAFLLDFAYPHMPYRWRKALILLGYGLFIEVVQYFLPYRSASLLDWIADGLGLVLYAWSEHWLRRVPLFQWRWRKLPD